ncbi:homeobox domain-containing protein [Loa loa]|uniref:Homeobox domain-containing protein n=2 Tax=Loa loa TaxID=7209 RepID=A0A1S0TX84_LOALO|nr:homeobox domain-containing protein [Loa loa]EFO21653.1 homeobox domain-containing protein [Loa loa]
MCLHASPCNAAITLASYVNPSVTQNQCSLGTRFTIPVTPTAPSTLYSSLFNTSSTFQQQQQLLQQSQNLSPISSNQNPETLNIFSELNAIKEPILNVNATCYPLLPSLESLLPLTLLQLDQHISKSMFTPQTSPASTISTLTSNHKITEIKGFQQPTEWITPIRHPLTTTNFHRQFLINENNSDNNSMGTDMKRSSDFSINRLLRKHCSGSTLNKRCDISTSNRHQHDERTGKGRKQRTIYGVSQTKILEKAFEEQQYMVGTEREMLAERLGLSEAQVRVWFQNRRSKWRKQLRANIYV